MALAPTAASRAASSGRPIIRIITGPRLRPRIGFVDAGYDSCYRTRTVWTPFGYRLRTINICAYLIEPHSRFQKAPVARAAGVFASHIEGTLAKA